MLPPFFEQTSPGFKCSYQQILRSFCCHNLALLAVRAGLSVALLNAFGTQTAADFLNLEELSNEADFTLFHFTMIARDLTRFSTKGLGWKLFTSHVRRILIAGIPPGLVPLPAMPPLFDEQISLGFECSYQQIFRCICCFNLVPCCPDLAYM